MGPSSNSRWAAALLHVVLLHTTYVHGLRVVRAPARRSPGGCCNEARSKLTRLVAGDQRGEGRAMLTSFSFQESERADDHDGFVGGSDGFPHIARCSNEPAAVEIHATAHVHWQRTVRPGASSLCSSCGLPSLRYEHDTALVFLGTRPSALHQCLHHWAESGGALMRSP